MKRFVHDAQLAKIYQLGRPLEAATPVSPSHPAFRMALLRRHGDVVRSDGSSGANELMTLGGHTGTHIDALAHVSVRGTLHGGLDAHKASLGGRFQKLGVETIGSIVCRGLLFDMPRQLGVTELGPGQPITASDLDQTCLRLNVTVERGDGVLIRTGWPTGRHKDNEAFVGWETGVPGPDPSAARWLVERGVRVTGSDTIAFERLESGAGHTRLPVHSILLYEAGIPIIEVLDLDELARDSVVEFLLVLSPLRLVGATASPVNPIALVLANSRRR